MIAESVAFLVAAGQARDLRRRALLRRLARRPRATRSRACRRPPRRAPRTSTLCDTNGASLPGAGRRAPCAPSAPRCRTPSSASTATTTPSAGWRTRSPPSAEGAVLVQGTMNGYGERCGNANLTSIVPSLQLKLGHDCLPTLEGWTEAAHYLDELLNLTPDPNQPYVGKNAFAHKGGMHVAGVNADPATFEHIDPAAVGNSREVLVSELSGKGTVIAHARRRARRRDRVTGGRAREGARAPRLPVRGRRRLVRPADPARDRRLRAAVPARVLARDLREARGRPRPDRGDDQDLGRRPALRPCRRGQRPGQRARHRAAGRDRRALSAPARHQARQLQGPHPRRVEGDRRHHARAARRHRRHRHVGRDRRPRERDRGELGRARRLARGRHGPHAGRAGRSPACPPTRRGRSRSPRPGPRRSGGAGGHRGAALRPALARTAAAGVRDARSPQGRGAPRQRRLLRHRGLHLALRAVGVEDGDEVVTSPFSFVASANAIVFERAKPVFADIDPVTLNLDPDAAAAAITGRTKALLPVHIFGYPADIPAFERHGLPIVEDACEALGAVARRRHAGRRPQPSGDVRLLRQQAAHHRRGRDAHDGLGRAQGARRLRAQPGPRARHGLARPRPARLQLPAHRHRLRARPGAARPARRACSPAARAWPGWYREALADSASHAAVRGRTAATCAAGSCSSSSSRTGSTATRTIEALRDAGRAVQAVPARDPPDVASTASASGTARASSRCARTSPRGRSRCRSSRR